MYIIEGLPGLHWLFTVLSYPFHHRHQGGIQRSLLTLLAIIHHFNQQKFIMLGLNENPSDSLLSNRIIRLLTMTCKNGNGKFTPSEVSQKHISEKVGGSYPTSKAIEALEEAVRLGYGTMGDCTTPNNRTVKQFRNRGGAKASRASDKC